MKIKTKNISLVVYDFDGVMTDNCAFVDDRGHEYVKVNRSDGLAISKIRKFGINQIIISTEKNKVVQKRAEKLNIKCINGVKDKSIILTKYCNDNNIELSKVVYIGNDINDYEVMKIVGMTFCPFDAAQIIKNISTHTFNTCGGNGVVREFLDYLDI